MCIFYGYTRGSENNFIVLSQVKIFHGKCVPFFRIFMAAAAKLKLVACTILKIVQTGDVYGE